MLTKKQLRRYKNLKLEINLLQEQKKNIELWLQHPAAKTARPDKEPAGKHRREHGSVEDAMIQLENLEQHYDHALCELLDLLTTIETEINKLNEKEQLLIKLHYMKGYTWEKTAETLGYEIRQVYRLHGHILLKLKK